MQMDIKFSCFKWYLDSIDLSSGIHKWCLDQLTNDILQVVLMKTAKVQEMVFIDKSNKWFHTRKFFQVVSHLHVVSIMQDDGSTSDPQL
jgi:hypothetical protein